MRRTLLPLLLLASTVSAQELTEQSLEHWLEYLPPKAAELRWRDIPWRATFWQAVIEAKNEGKPVLLWAMNGHPLGCT